MRNHIKNRLNSILIVFLSVLFLGCSPNSPQARSRQNPKWTSRKFVLLAAKNNLRKTESNTKVPRKKPSTRLRRIPPKAQVRVFTKDLLQSSIVRVSVKILNRDRRNYTVVHGTGFFWDRKGTIVTNFHNIDSRPNDPEIAIQALRNYEGDVLKVRLVGYNKSLDIAVLKSELRNTKPITIGNLSKLHVGATVFAVGFPFQETIADLQPTVSSGIISALGRIVRKRNGKRISGLIQTDAPISSGNSGGPLLDTKGRILGMVTFNIARQGLWRGAAFAVPIHTVKQAVKEILRSVVSQPSILDAK